MLRKGMFLADRYEILDQIGTGGMSDVYKAKCHKLNRFVAIKVLKQEFSDDKNFVSKFRIEAQSAAGLTHPNVVNVYDVGDENGIHYIVMELVEGITLKKYIEKKGKLSSKEAVSIAIQVAQGIEAAHHHHIVHRDIKPQNIIISKDGKVKVTDFGIARAATTNTINSSAMGSVHYISPEQARGGYSDEKSDIYSFGITLYEMLTGTVPFDGDTTVAVAVQHIQDEIAPPSVVVDDIPVSVDKIVVKCTQKKTDRRYQNATDLIADLKKSLVMPNVDFVKMTPVYGQVSNSDVDRSFGDFDDLEMNSYDEDQDDEDDNEDNDISYDDGEDIEDGGNEKIDKIMKWIGIAIAAIIVIITIFVVVKLVGAFAGVTGTSTETTASSTETTTAASVDSSNQVTVPDVVGMTEDAAKQALNAVGLGYKASKQSSDTVAEGNVISQNQKAGVKVAKNSTITLSISEGSSTFTIANVVGKTEDEASSTLKTSGLTVTIDYQYSNTVTQGNVISQTPTSGASVKSGDAVKLVISRGKQTTSVQVPNLIGKTESQARQSLDALGLVASVSAKKVASTTVAEGGVVSQSYTAGKSVTTGTTVEIVLSSGSNSDSSNTTSQVSVPSVVGKSETDAKTALSNVGLGSSVAYASSSTVNQGVVISQSNIAGSSVNSGSTIIIVVSTGPDTGSTKAN